MLFDEHEDEHAAGVDIAIKGKRMEDGSIFLRLRITDKNNPGDDSGHRKFGGIFFSLFVWELNGLI
jgi:hypothetical protein